MKDNLLFDLDGTIIDPAEGITGAAKYALQTMGHPPLTQAQLEKFIGPPLDEAFVDECGFSAQEATQAIQYFREYFSQYGIHQHTLYPGFATLLQALSQKKHRLFLATSKPTLFAKQILDSYNLTHYFSDIQGSELEGPGTPKGKIIYTVLQENALLPETCLMIGDRKHDILGAKQNNMLSVGMLHGYGGQQELKSAKADYIVADAKALALLLHTPL